MAKKKAKKRRKIFTWYNILIFILVLIIIGLGTGFGIFMSYVKDAPEFDPKKLKPSETSMVFDQDGKVMAELHGEQNRVPVPIETIPKNLINAFIAIEDQYFYSHKGVNIRSIIGSLATNLMHGGIKRGASTITQQLVKTAFLSPEQAWKRKAQEAWLAIQLERHYTKNEIMEFYLNQIYFGHSAYGVESAADTYFGKSIDEVNLAEAAMLAGITKGPEYYSPYLNFDRAKERQEIILNTMAELEYISKDEAENAKKEELNLVGIKNVTADYKAPYFTDYVIRELAAQLQKELGLTEDEAYKKIYTDGLKIYTTVDMKIQEAAEKTLADPNNYPYSKDDDNEIVQPQAAAVIIDPHTGHIKALVGGREHQRKLGFNRASQAFRQPGSTFKPIMVYTAAVDMGYTAGTVIDNSPVSYPSGSGGIWSPKNYTNDFKGLTTIRKAVADSVNVVAVKVFNAIGVDRGIEYAQKLGIKNLVLTGDKNDRQLSAALGGITKGVTPLELASAFGTLANEGIHVEPIAILKVVDKSGRTIFENKPEQWSAVSKQTAFIVTDMMRSVVTEGTGWRVADFPFPVAGKTGTTSDDKDVWWVAYTPHLTGVVWMGHDDPATMRNVAGGYQPALIWKKIMTVAHQNLPKKQFEKPDGIVGPIEICIDSGKLPTELCSKDPRGHRTRKEYFIRGTQPTEHCDVHVEDFLDVSTGLLATEFCPEELVERTVFIKRREPFTPSPTGQIPLDAKYELPTEYCDVHESEPVITIPDENDYEDWFNGDDDEDNNGWFNGNDNDNFENE
ncbi:MAG: penicillin-binding protein 1A [Tepidanaerobacteraceae bacterium]|nr:penicillin-binding protein 1A [Tepidanaerobacteraceae bacterium]